MSEIVKVYASEFVFVPLNREKDQSSKKVSFFYDRDYLLVKFDNLSQANRRRQISDAKLTLWLHSHISGTIPKVLCYVIQSSWQPNAVDYATAGTIYSASVLASGPYCVLEAFNEGVSPKRSSKIYRLSNPISNGFIFRTNDKVSTQNPVDLYTEDSSDGMFGPYLELSLEGDNRLGLYSTYPTSGSRVSKKQETVFGFTAKPVGVSYDLPELTSCQLWYRTAGTEVLSIISGDIKSQTIRVPANTFSADTIEYKIAITDSFGNSAVSGAWHTIYTNDTPAVASPAYPVDLMLEGNQPCTFKWNYANESGTAPTKSELQYRTESGGYTSLRTITGSLTEAVLPANTFSSGTYYWRVRTYNADGVAGAWSDEARFIVVSAPSKPIISISDLSPRPLVTWQANAQQAYEIEAGQYHETYYGTEKSWRFPDFLPDGTYNARVRVQGLYGLWSEFAETEFSVSNTGSGTVNLTVAADKNAELFWAESNPHTYAVVYRNGIPVHKTTENMWSDTLGSGTCEYYVICYNANDYNYAKSNSVKLHVAPPAPMLLNLDTGEELELPLAATQHRTFNFSGNRDIRFLHFSGKTAPLAELTEFEEKRISVTCAYLDDETHDKLLEFSKHLLCFRSPRGMRIIGYTESFRDEETQFYNSAGFTIRQTDYEEMIDIDS